VLAFRHSAVRDKGMGLMPRALKAFISYRREDAYVQVAEDGKPGNSFILDLKAALLKAGFEAVFVDIEAMEEAMSLPTASGRK
jgi:hypothetical protein